MNRISDNSISLMDKKTLTCKEVCLFLGIGRNTARKIGIESGAVRRIGRRVLYDRQALESFIDGKGE